MSMILKMVNYLLRARMNVLSNLRTYLIKFYSIRNWLPLEMATGISQCSFLPFVGSVEHCIFNQSRIVSLDNHEFKHSRVRRRYLRSLFY